MNNSTNTRYLRPAASIVENADGFTIEADMPGVTRDGLELTVDKDTLTISGRRDAKKLGARELHRETSELSYRRAFELGREINRQGVAAQFDNGVLRVFLPKAEELKPRRIEIAA